MAPDGSPVGDPIPELTDAQHSALHEYLDRHRRLRDTLAPYPMLIARVLADDKRAACVDPVTGVVPSGYADRDEYLPDVFRRMGLHTRQLTGTDGWYVARTAWRLDLLPTEATFTDAYHRRCGIVFGYPADAIDQFIESDGVTVTLCDIGRSGVIPPEEVAYLVFVSYTREQSIDQYTELIATGKAIRRRITELSEAWELPGLETHTEDVYQNYVAAYSGDGGTWTPSMTIDPDGEVTEDDVRPLLS